MTAFFTDDPRQTLPVVVRRRGVEKIPLLLGGGELGVPLHADQIEERVADTLVRHLQDVLPLFLPGISPELDVRSLQLPQLDLPAVLPQLAGVESDLFLPAFEQIH